MKTKNKFLAAIMATVCFLLAPALFAGTYTTLWQDSTTNVTAAYNNAAGLNSSGAVTNNYIIGTVGGASNVFFYLSGTTGTQPALGTNSYLPAAAVSPQGTYPGSLYGPYNNMAVVVSANIMATNATATSISFRFAGSIDGVNWFTNFYVHNYNIPTTSTTAVTPITYSNVVTYAVPFICLQEIDNPGVAAVTNILVEVSGKPGL